MKKTFTLLTLIGALIFSTQSNAQNDIATKNGFSLNLELGFASADYGKVPSFASDVFEYSTTYGLQIGNRWYVADFDQSGGIAITANWLSFSYASEDVQGLTARMLEGTFLEIGGMYSFPIGNDMAIDGFYNFEPTYAASAVLNDDDGLALVGFGFGHAVGAAFRYKILNIGVEYHFGTIDASFETVGNGISNVEIPDSATDITNLDDFSIDDTISDVTDISNWPNEDLDISQVKITIGVKF